MSKKERIKNYLISIILGNKLKQGDKIPSEFNLCKIFHSSRTPVREALKELSYSNWIQPEKGKGYFVSGLGSYEAHYAKGAFKISNTNIREFNKTELKFIPILNNKVKNSKMFVKEYKTSDTLIIKTLNLVDNNYLFLLSKEEIQRGFIQGLLKHKVQITHQNRSLKFLDIKDPDVLKMGWPNEYPTIITNLYIGNIIIESSIIIIDKKYFHFEKKVMF